MDTKKEQLLLAYKVLNKLDNLEGSINKLKKLHDQNKIDVPSTYLDYINYMKKV